MSAVEIREKASEWIARRMLGPWSETDEAALAAWRTQSLSHEIAYLRMEAGWSRTERLSVLRDPGKLAPRVPSKYRTISFRVAVACVAATALVGVASFYAPPSNEQIYSTAVGGHKIITLTDGSRIELNTDTVIRTSFKSSRRAVTLLKGEAYFQVEHDVQRPFVVMADRHEVIDLGTKFLIRKNAGEVKVSLIEGQAELKSADSAIQQHSVVLTPGDVAVASAQSLSVVRKSEKVLHDELGWQRGVIVFSHTSLAQAAAEFNRYNATKIVIADETARKRLIGATLAAHDVDAFADVAREVFGLRIQKKPGEILITR
jgi:transmembrane sensor